LRVHIRTHNGECKALCYMLVRLKGGFDKETLAKVYNTKFAPHIFLIVRFLNILINMNKKCICIFCSVLLPFSWNTIMV
jgi:hypothetical protein